MDLYYISFCVSIPACILRVSVFAHLRLNELLKITESGGRTKQAWLLILQPLMDHTTQKSQNLYHSCIQVLNRWVQYMYAS